MEFVELMLVVTFAAICAVDELSFGHLLIGAIVARLEDEARAALERLDRLHAVREGSRPASRP